MIPYRAKRVLQRLMSAVLILAVLAVLVLLCWLLWLERYVIYTKDGAKLDFSLSQQYGTGYLPQAPTPGPTVHITYEDPKQDEADGPKEFTRFSGYYVELADLLEQFDWVVQSLNALPRESTVMLEIKSVKSLFYYTTGLGNQADLAIAEKVDMLIDSLQTKNHYLIARIPAFQEYHYILENERERVPYGLPIAGGNGSLWLDREIGCYWMNPASEGAISYLIQIVTELRNKGFDEVVFSDFRYPETDQIKFPEDKDTVLNQTATTLVKTCATDSFAVSFTRTKADLSLPEGRTRLYLTGVAAADAAAAAQGSGLADPTVQVVFLTEQNDTRYDIYCALRPLSTLH